MKGAKRCLRLCRLFSCFVCSLFGRSSGPSLSTTRQTGSMVRLTSALTTRVTSRSCGRSAASLATVFLAIFLSFSLSFPRVASANPATITLTVWNLVVTALNALDSRIANNVAVRSADDLQVIASNLQVWTGTPSQAQTIAQELERASGYDIDSGNHINTVHSLTGNTSYDQEQICPDCAGGYVATSTGLEVCDTCGGDGMYYWDTVPYLSTHECMLYLASWIRYLSATQTDWTSNVGSYRVYEFRSMASNDSNSSSNSHKVSVQYGTFADGSFVAYSGSTYVSLFTLNPYYCNYGKVYLSDSVCQSINDFVSDGYDVALCAWDDGQVHVVKGHGLYFSYDAVRSNLSLYRLHGSDMVRYSGKKGAPVYDVTIGGFICAIDSFSRTTNFGSSVIEPCWFCPDVIKSSVEVPSSASSSDGGVTWGTDIDWYTDTSDAGAAGGTTVVNEGDTVYNTENNTYTTTYNMDVEPITQRLDILNAINAQIGVDLRTLDASMFKELNDLEWWLQRIYYAIATMNNTLESIRSDMANLDRSTNDLVDLSTLESGVSGLSSDIGALLSAITGSHGADALGLYGRLDTVLNWLDDYAPVDVSGIEQALEDWPDYPVFDDSDLLNAITGSHGSDLLGLFGRLDNVLSWLDSYVAPDLATLNHQLGDLLDSDGQTPTVHGLIYSVNGYVEDIDGLLSDVLALGTVTVNGTTYGFTDLLYNTWLDLSRLVGMSTVTAGEDTYSFADLLYNVWVDFGRLRDWLVEWWADLFARLDDIIDAIEDLPHDGANPWHTSPVVDPSDPEGGPIIGPIETDPYGYPKMPDWTVYKEPLNIPALEHAVDELMTKFPFSMLNTIIQVALFIERPAVAPQFDIPAPNPSDWSQPYLVHVDLSDYDTVAATLRLGIVIWAIVKISNRTINMWVGDKGGD